MVDIGMGSGWWASGRHDDLVSCSEGSEEFGSPFIFLKEFQGIPKVGLVLP